MRVFISLSETLKKKKHKESNHIKNSNIDEVKEEICRKDQLIEDLKEKVDKFEEVCFEMTRNQKYYQNFLIKES